MYSSRPAVVQDLIPIKRYRWVKHIQGYIRRMYGGVDELDVGSSIVENLKRGYTEVAFDSS